jgi:hypothetical protein
MAAGRVFRVAGHLQRLVRRNHYTPTDRIASAADATPHQGGDTACPDRARAAPLGWSPSATEPNAQLSSRLTRERALKHEEPLFASPVGCSAFFGGLDAKEP